ncbi:hypothetical protein FQZ97_1198880 [compost metagenome]
MGANSFAIEIAPTRLRFHTLTLAKVDSPCARLSATPAVDGVRTNSSGTGIRATTLAFWPARSSRGGMPKYSR